MAVWDLFTLLYDKAMKINIYFCPMLQNYVITAKELNEPYIWIESCDSVPEAEHMAEEGTEVNELFAPQLDEDLANESGYALSEDDKTIYCVTL